MTTRGAGRLNVVVFPVALVADDEGDVARVAGDEIVEVDADAEPLQPGLEKIRAVLAAVLGDHNASHVEAGADEFIPQAQHIRIVGDPQVAPDLVVLDVAGADDDDDLGLVGKLL